MDFISPNDDGDGGDSWRHKIRKASCSQMITTNKPTPSFLQASCP